MLATMVRAPPPGWTTRFRSHCNPTRVGLRKARRKGADQLAAQFVNVVLDCDSCQVEQRISLVTLGVTDLHRARSFYEAMGWVGAQQPNDEVCFFQAGGLVLGLWIALGGHGAPGVELAHNVRAPEEDAVVLAEAEQAGGKIVRHAPSGAACPEPSPTPTATCGKSPTTRAGPSPMTGPSVSDILLGGGDQSPARPIALRAGRPVGN